MSETDRFKMQVLGALRRCHIKHPEREGFGPFEVWAETNYSPETVSNYLRRLVKSGEVETVKYPGGKVYRLPGHTSTREKLL